MTAEIAILNKATVVLAADSAMTLGGIEKVYPEPARRLSRLLGRLYSASSVDQPQ